MIAARHQWKCFLCIDRARQTQAEKKTPQTIRATNEESLPCRKLQNFNYYE